jgi:hypothetical protein
VVVGGIAVLALALLLGGASRKRAHRVETKQQVRRVRSQKEQLLEENAALRAQLADPYPMSVSPETEAINRTS